MGEPCPTCDGERWVCEAHPDRPWNDTERGCTCGPGTPCPVCNPCDEHTPPELPPGTVILCQAGDDPETIH